MNELKPGQFIKEFVSLGPKTYVCKTNDNACVMKVKGFTLSGKAEKQIRLKTMLNLLNRKKEQICVNYKGCLKRQKFSFVISQTKTKKNLSVTYDKRRIIDEDWNTLPFRFRWVLALIKVIIGHLVL